ncbi:efflux RND transporter periplasmic adaptor subunit [Thiolapillus sp.]
MGRKLIKWMIWLIVIVAVVIVGIRVISNKKAALSRIPAAKIYAIVAPTQVARKSSIQLTVPYLAEVRSDSDVDIASKVTSRVNMIVPIGTVVKRGDVIVKLDAAELLARKKGLQLKVSEVKNQIKAKYADLKNLKRVHEHTRELLASQVIPKDKFDTESANIESLQATIAGMKNKAAALEQNIQEIEDSLTYTRIQAPMDGVVSKTYVAEGGIASSGKHLLSLAGGDGKRLVVRVPDDVKPAALLMKSADRPCPLLPLNSTFNGLDEYSCQMRTDLAAGNRVAVRLMVFSGEGFLLPFNAVLELNGKHQVLIVQGDQASPKSVQIRGEGSQGLVVKGLKSGDEYVVAKPDILLKLLTGVAIVKAAR